MTSTVYEREIARWAIKVTREVPDIPLSILQDADDRRFESIWPPQVHVLDTEDDEWPQEDTELQDAIMEKVAGAPPAWKTQEYAQAFALVSVNGFGVESVIETFPTSMEAREMAHFYEGQRGTAKFRVRAIYSRDG